MRAFNLVELARKLPGGGQRNRLKGTIRKAWSAYSIKLDLLSAQRYLLLLNALDQRSPFGDQPEDDATMGRALFTAAVVEYMRATQTSTKHRSSLDLQRDLNPTQLREHRRIADLRNDTLGHWGPGRDRAGASWHEHLFVLVERDDESLGACYPYKTINYLAGDVAALGELVACTLITVEKIQSDAHHIAMKTLIELIENDESVRKYILKSGFDPNDFYLNSDAVQNFWAITDYSSSMRTPPKP